MTEPIEAEVPLIVALPEGSGMLVAEALQQAAAQRRRAAEAAAGELLSDAGPGEDIRTDAARIIRVLGQAAVLERAANMVREYAAGMLTPDQLAGLVTAPAAPAKAGPRPAAGQQQLPVEAPAAAVNGAKPAAKKTARKQARKAGPPPADPRAAASLAALQNAGPEAAVLGTDDEDEPAPDDVVDVDLDGSAQ